MSATRLAIDGGRPAVQPASHNVWPHITADDDRAVLRALHAPSQELGHPQSVFLRDLEASFAAYCGVHHCVTLASGTDAVEIALRAVGVQAGDEVIVPALMYATAHGACMLGATPVFVDIDRRTFNLDVRRLAGVVTERTKAIVPVHLNGLAVEMEPVHAVAREIGATVVEDAAQAVGAEYRGRKVGSLGTVGAFSLHTKKMLTGLEGGLLVTDNDDVAHAARLFACFGEERVVDPDAVAPHWARWLGRNSRVHPLGGALAASQLERLDDYVQAAQANAAVLTAGMTGLPGVIAPAVPDDCTHTFYEYRVLLDPVALGWEGDPRELRDRVIRALRAEGVWAGMTLVEPFPRMPLFRRDTPTVWTPGTKDGPLTPWDGAAFPVATAVLNTSIVLGRTPHPLQRQTPQLMRWYVDAFEKVCDRIERVKHAEYTPLPIVPAIPSDDLA